MPRNRLPRVKKYYFPIGRRSHGRPLKRLVDTWDRNGSTGGLTAWQIYNDDDDDLKIYYDDDDLKIYFDDDDLKIYYDDDDLKIYYDDDDLKIYYDDDDLKIYYDDDDLKNFEMNKFVFNSTWNYLSSH